MNIADERKDLICMRDADMVNRHPKTDYTHCCALCLERVGIFPSGQAVLASHAPGMIRIICTHCADMSRYKVLFEANRELDT